ncbi:Do family serine endopeptidase [Acidisoma sp.]|uniref:Do family serine endopeptidase n=1 Tax=Acidisoma sp. TaxID=1872115 RepID=UPI003AFF8762
MRLLLLASAFALMAPTAAAVAHDAPAGFADLAAQLLPSVVNIASTESAASASADNEGNTTGGGATPGAQTGAAPGGQTASTGVSGSLPPVDRNFQSFLSSAEGPGSPDASGGGTQMQSLGSGFIIDASGLVVTNNHVIDGAETMSVILADGTSLPATLVGRDTVNDIALLRVHPAHPLTAVHFGASRSARIGDWVIAIGNPYGLGGTVTAGIVSARGRDLDEDGASDYIQTDAAINRGNSGGPLFDMSGEVVGVNTAIYSPSGGSVGIGFAIPSDEVEAVVDQLRLYGKPRRGWMGVQVQNVTPDIASALGMPDAVGAMVGTVAPGGPAAQAHLQPGDIILGFNGRLVPDMKAFPRMVEDSGVGDAAVVDYWRSGHPGRATLTIADEPAEPAAAPAPKPAAAPAPPAPASVAGLGLTLSNVTPGLQSKFDLPSGTQGVVITAVAPNSVAARQGLAAGDVILELGGAPVGRIGDVLSRIAALRAARRNQVLLLVQGSDDTQWISLDPGWAG